MDYVTHHPLHVTWTCHMSHHALFSTLFKFSQREKQCTFCLNAPFVAVGCCVLPVLRFVFLVEVFRFMHTVIVCCECFSLLPFCICICLHSTIVTILRPSGFTCENSSETAAGFSKNLLTDTLVKIIGLFQHNLVLLASAPL